MTAAEPGDATGAGGGSTGRGNGGSTQARMLRDAGRANKWAVAWIAVAAGLWLYFAYLMLSSYGPVSYSGERYCEGPLKAPFEQDGYRCHSELRQWPALVGIMALASLTSVVAAATKVYAKLLSRVAWVSGPPTRSERGPGPQQPAA